MLPRLEWLARSIAVTHRSTMRGGVRTPPLAFHGAKDFLPVDLMRNFMLQVINNDMPVKMLIFQDAHHGFGRNAATSTVPFELYDAQEQILWFRQYWGTEQ